MWMWSNETYVYVGDLTSTFVTCCLVIILNPIYDLVSFHSIDQHQVGDTVFIL